VTLMNPRVSPDGISPGSTLISAVVIQTFSIGGWPGFKDLELVDIEAAERISLQQFPRK